MQAHKHHPPLGKVRLGDLRNLTPINFSYLFGDSTTETVELARTAGFNCACSMVEDIVWQQTDCLQLPRFGVGNWNGEEFAKQLLRWFHA